MSASPNQGWNVMKEERARHILQALVQGVDPLTGEELPTGTILQQADVLRALLAGVVALEQTTARAQRRAQLPDNVGRPWSEDEEQTLIAAFKSNDPLPDIAARHGRTLRAIEARLERLGLLTPEQRTTNNSFVKEPDSDEWGLASADAHWADARGRHALDGNAPGSEGLRGNGLGSEGLLIEGASPAQPP
jgi:hypothetical protein